MSEPKAYGKIMDLKSLWNDKADLETAAKRSECFSCEHYRYNIWSGTSLEGEPQKQWICKLIDEQHQPCKFEITEGSRQPQKTVEPRLPSNQDRPEKPQPQLSKQPVQYKPKTCPPNSSSTEPPLPSLPKMEKPEVRPDPASRKRK